MKAKYIVQFCVVFLIVVFLSGCTVVFQKGRRSDLERIESLEQELDELRNARALLEERLSDELAQKQVSVKMEDKGLVITFIAEVLFDSGKAKLREDSLPILSKVARILNEEVPDYAIGIEGHTDNEPIKYSSWKSNWELSTARATSVLHHLEEKGIEPTRLSATGYGEYKPVASNATAEGRQKNRRVEVVILPKYTKVESEIEVMK